MRDSENLIIAGLGVIGIVGLVLGILSAYWWLWCTVLGFFWPTGPAQVIDPPFWYFVGGWFLVGCFANMFKSKKEG